MKCLDDNWVVIILGCAIFTWLGLLIYLQDSGQISGDIEIEFKGIKLVDVSPRDCFNEDFSSEFCPVPEDIIIKIQGSVPESFIRSLGGTR